MVGRAKVESIEHLEVFAETLRSSRAKLLQELESLALQLHRLTAWFANEAMGYWMAEARKAERRMVECRDALSRCQSVVREAERRPCTHERIRLQKAESRLQLCHEKIRATRLAIEAWENSLAKQFSKLQRCRDLAESDLLVALRDLQATIHALQAYAGLTGGTSHSDSTDNSAVQRPDIPRPVEGADDSTN